jgi:hypothetical protein
MGRQMICRPINSTTFYNFGNLLSTTASVGNQQSLPRTLPCIFLYFG